MCDIKAGDLVMVAKAMPCCGANFKIGYPFTVKEIYFKKYGECGHCGHKIPNSFAALDYSGWPFSMDRLIKINPPSIDESTETKQELPEHA